jgi:hypothetical protein
MKFTTNVKMEEKFEGTVSNCPKVGARVEAADVCTVPFL